MSKQPERRRRVVRAFAPAVGLLAAGLLVWQGSYAAFNATSQATGSSWGAGTLKLQNDGSALTGLPASFAKTQTVTWGGTTLKPGATGTVCVNVQSSGSSGGAVEFYRNGATTETAGPAGAAYKLGDQISLNVNAIASSSPLTNCANFSSLGTPVNVINNVALTALPTAWAAPAGSNYVTVAASGYAVYQITWTFNSLGSPAQDNNYQGAGTAASFQWEMQ